MESDRKNKKKENSYQKEEKWDSKNLRKGTASL